jgi:ribosomal protein L22
MPYTFKPKEKHAKARSTLFVSPKDALIICKVIRKKKLTTVKRLLNDLNTRKRSLSGKYYSHAVLAILKLLNSCEKNAEALGIDIGKIFVYATSSNGPVMKRRRRRSDFGHAMKVANVEIILVEKGKEKSTSRKPAKEEKRVESKPRAEPKAEVKTEKTVAKEAKHTPEAKNPSKE